MKKFDVTFYKKISFKKIKIYAFRLSLVKFSIFSIINRNKTKKIIDFFKFTFQREIYANFINKTINKAIFFYYTNL